MELSGINFMVKYSFGMITIWITFTGYDVTFLVTLPANWS